MCGGSDAADTPIVAAPAPIPAPTPPTAPSTPNPRATADQQYQYNLQAGKDTAFYGAMDQYGPLGASIWARDAQGTPYAQAIQLSPELQAQLDAQFGQQGSLYGAAQRQLGYLPQDRFQLPTDATGRDLARQAFGSQVLDPSRFADPLSGDMSIAPTASTSDIAAASYAQSKSMFEPDLEAARKQTEIKLAQRGINPGDEIWRDEMDRLDRQANQAYAGAARQATLDSGQEQSRQFGQNLSSAEYDMGRRGFLSNVQGQQFSQLANALGYGDQAYQQGIQNQLLARSAPFQEAQAYMQAAPQYALPQFQQGPNVQFDPADYTGVVNNNTAAKAKMYGDQLAAQSNVYGSQLQHQASMYGTQAGQRNANVNAASQGSGAWGAVGQIGAAAVPLMFSDENMKENRHPADGERVLDSLRDMPVDDYRYRADAQSAYGLPEHRTGTMAQDYAEHFGGDGKTIDLGDAVGKLMAAMKALDARTRKTENA